LVDPLGPHILWVTTDVDPQADSYNVIRGSCRPFAHSKLMTCADEQITGAACAGPASCLLTTGYGAIITSTKAAGGASTWTRAVIYGAGHADRGYYGLSDPVCFSTGTCYILGARGDLLMSATPFDPDPGSWKTVHIPIRPGDALATLDCPTISICYVFSPTNTKLTSSRVAVGHVIRPPRPAPTGGTGGTGTTGKTGATGDTGSTGATGP
jgi:hypothetical protein